MVSGELSSTLENSTAANCEPKSTRDNTMTLPRLMDAMLTELLKTSAAVAMASVKSERKPVEKTSSFNMDISKLLKVTPE